MLTEKLQNMELEDVNDSIPIEELNKLLQIPVIIDEDVRKALQDCKQAKLDKKARAKQDEKDVDHFIEKFRKNH